MSDSVVKEPVSGRLSGALEIGIEMLKRYGASRTIWDKPSNGNGDRLPYDHHLATYSELAQLAAPARNSASCAKPTEPLPHKHLQHMVLLKQLSKI